VAGKQKIQNYRLHNYHDIPAKGDQHSQPFSRDHGDVPFSLLMASETPSTEVLK